MKEINKNILDDSKILFDDYFNDMDLDADIKVLYDSFANSDQLKKYEEQAKLNKIRSENHKKYHNIDFVKLSNLPGDLNEIVLDIKEYCSYIDVPNLLNQNMDLALNTQKILEIVYKKLNILNEGIDKLLNDLLKTNDIKQSKLSVDYLKNLSLPEDLKKIVLDKYNELVLYNAVIVNEKYENLKRQVIRAKYISEIYKILKIDEDNRLEIDKNKKIQELNKKIENEIERYKSKIHYLEDIMIEKSKFSLEFTQFKRNYINLFVYDDTDYESVKQKYDFFVNNEKFDISVKSFENLFIEEREKLLNEEGFIKEKVGIKNIKRTLDYIVSYYMNMLDDESKNIIAVILNNLNTNKYNIDDINNALSIIIKEIWKNTITDVYSYNPNEDYYFICSNNQFIDEKYQTILITRDEIQKVNNYEDYQIGFICGYNNNIMYITENDDIMTVNYNDLSNLKTPKQLENEFLNFKICNRIALNGFKTKIDAVYYINDGSDEKYMKAVELANMYELPLIEINKGKIN